MTSQITPPASPAATTAASKLDTNEDTDSSDSSIAPLEEREEGGYCTLVEADSDWYGTIKMVRHGDHHDRIVTTNKWEEPSTEEAVKYNIEWPPSPISYDESGSAPTTNAHLDEDEKSQAWSGLLPSLLERPYAPGALDDLAEPEHALVPLFDADNGDEYQLSSYQYSDMTSLYCPERLEEDSANSNGCFSELAARAAIHAEAPSANASSAIPIPKLVVQLGSLRVRTKSRHTTEEHPVAIENTEYEIIADLGHKDIPLWIVAPRSSLSLRASGTNKGEPFPSSLPVFDGLMATSDGGHDVACIMPSVRDLFSTDPEKRRAMYKTACQLVRATRVTVDPIRVEIHQDELYELADRELDDWPIAAPPPPTGYVDSLWEGLSGFIKYFTWDA